MIDLKLLRIIRFLGPKSLDSCLFRSTFNPKLLFILKNGYKSMIKMSLQKGFTLLLEIFTQYWRMSSHLLLQSKTFSKEEQQRKFLDLIKWSGRLFQNRKLDLNQLNLAQEWLEMKLWKFSNDKSFLTCWAKKIKKQWWAYSNQFCLQKRWNKKHFEVNLIESLSSWIRNSR